MEENNKSSDDGFNLFVFVCAVVGLYISGYNYFGTSSVSSFVFSIYTLVCLAIPDKK